MRIALVNSEYASADGSGGIASYTHTMANALAAKDHTVHVIGRDQRRPGDLDPTISFHEAGFSRSPFLERLFERLLLARPFRWEKGVSRAVCHRVAGLKEKKGLDIVEVPDYGGLGYFLGNSQPLPLIINFHLPSETVDSLNDTPVTSVRKQWHRFEERAIRNATAYRCPSNALKKMMSQRYGIAQDSITCIRNPIDLRLFDTIKDKYARPIDRIDLLFAGRLERRKGIELITRNIRYILALDPRITITFAGNAEISGATNYRLQAENALADDERGRVWFLGPVNRSQLTVLYCRSTMLLFPSLFENAPYVLLEAMAARLPVIAASSGGISELVRHEKNGLLFTSDDLDGLSKSIKRFIDEPGLATSCADQAYRDVHAIYAPEAIADESIALYESALRPKAK
jgi:glycogen(starch) synthase